MRRGSEVGGDVDFLAVWGAKFFFRFGRHKTNSGWWNYLLRGEANFLRGCFFEGQKNSASSKFQLALLPWGQWCCSHLSHICLDRDVSSEYTDINDRTLWSQEAVTRSQPPSVLQDLKLYVSGHAEVGSTHFPFCKVSLFPLICLWHLVEPELSSKANCCRAIKFVLCLQATFG